MCGILASASVHHDGYVTNVVDVVENGGDDEEDNRGTPSLFGASRFALFGFISAQSGSIRILHLELNAISFDLKSHIAQAQSLQGKGVAPIQ